jgi:hypothetical protein
MVNLFDIMRNAQSGAGVQNLSRQFGLTGPDTQRALEALLPAFSAGFQRLAHDPNAFAQLLQMVTSGGYAPFFDAPQTSAASWEKGAEALTRIMGSKATSRIVAEQAAAATGMGVDVLQQMLPMVAATLIGGAFRYASLDGMGDMLARWSDAFKQAHAAQQPPKPVPRPSPASPFEIWLAALNPAQSVSRAPPPPPAPRNQAEAWSALVDAMLGGPAAAKPAPPAPPEPNPVQMLAQMFEAGSQAGAQYVASLKTIMDGAWEIPPQESGARS